MEDKYISCMLCFAIGDAIGYKNGIWEFLISDDKIYQYVALGGINRIDTKDWVVSDDTILHIQMADSLLEDFDTLEDLGKILSENLIEATRLFSSEGFSKRSVGDATYRNTIKLKNGMEWNKLPYDHMYGGNGAAMRNLPIGLAYHNNFDKMMEISIETSRITHNSVTGYLGGFIGALFAYYAINNVKVEEWPFLLMKLYTDKTIEKYLKKVDRELEEYYKYASVFFGKWDSYIKDKFDSNGKVIEKRTNSNLIWRNKYYYNMQYSTDPDVPTMPGSGGDDCMIIVYNALIDAGDKWETLVFYAMLHLGDTDTTGAIAAGLYGIMYGMKDIPKINYKNIEFKKELIEIGKKLYKKFNSN